MSIYPPACYSVFMDTIVVAWSGPTRLEAEIIRSVLESAGIPAFVSVDDVGGLYALHFSLSAAGAKVMVKESDLPAALEVITASSSST